MSNVSELKEKLEELGMWVGTIRGEPVSIVDEKLAGDLLAEVIEIQEREHAYLD